MQMNLAHTPFKIEQLIQQLIKDANTYLEASDI